MGKSKKRIFNRCKYMSNPSYKRKDVVFDVVRSLKQNDFGEKPRNMISMFGLEPEELSEAGASYEELLAIRGAFF